MAALGDAFFIQTFTTTLQKYEKQLVDNVLTEHPILELFKSSAQSQTGRGLVIPIRAANLSATGYSDASGTHSTSVSADTMGSAVYTWADGIITPFRLKHQHILQNSGPEQIVNLVQEYVTAAAEDHKLFIAQELYAAASTWSTGQIIPLDLIVAATDKVNTTTARSLGGIRGGVSTKTVTNVARTGSTATVTVGAHDYIAGDSVVVSGLTNTALNGTYTLTSVTATEIVYTTATSGTISSTADSGTVVCEDIKDYWRSTRLSLSKATVDIVAAFRQVTNAIYKASSKRPTHVIAGMDVYEELEAFLQSKGQYTNPQGTAQTRFNEIRFGDLIVRMDADCPNDRAYFLNQPTWRFAYCAGEFMKAYPAQPIQGTLDTVVPLASTLQVGVAERRANGLLIRIP
jgi:hypothetical protein